MPHPYWPLFDLRIRTPRLELRIPDDKDLIELARLAARGVHPNDYMPFTIPWTDRRSPEMERSLFQFHWRSRGELAPAAWRLAFAIYEDGLAVGFQDMAARDFAILRTVVTGSWLGREHQGRGIGKEMRAAVLHLAFAGLGARVAESGAWADNSASLGVSRALGYAANGEDLKVRRGEATRHLLLRLERAAWERRRRDDIVLEGVEPCLSLLGAA
jgi:RimJ/RimL family protein N-acetyltransferase